MQETQEMRVRSRVGKILWSRKRQPIPVFLPGKYHGQKSLAGYNPWGHKASDTIERARTHTHTHAHTYTHTHTHTPLSLKQIQHFPRYACSSWLWYKHYRKVLEAEPWAAEPWFANLTLPDNSIITFSSLIPLKMDPIHKERKINKWPVNI